MICSLFIIKGTIWGASVENYRYLFFADSDRGGHMEPESAFYFLSPNVNWFPRGVSMGHMLGEQTSDKYNIS